MEIEVISDSNLSKVLNRIRIKNHTVSYKFCVNGDALRLANKHKESVPQYLQAIMQDRTNRDAHIGIALSYKAIGNIEKALFYFKKANEIKESCETLLEIGMCLYSLALYTDAIPYFRSAIKADSENLEAQTWLAMAHEELEEYNMAFLIYDHIIEQDPSYLNAYINKGTLEMSIDKYKEATGTFSQVIKINPDFYKAYFGIALCFDKLGKYRDAKRYYTKFISIKPHGDVADFVSARLKKLSSIALKRPRVSCHLSLVN